MKKIAVVLVVLAGSLAASPAPSAEAKPHCITHKNKKANAVKHKGHRHCPPKPAGPPVRDIPISCFTRVPVPAYCAPWMEYIR